MANILLPSWVPDSWKKPENWQSHSWQLKNSIRSIEQIKELNLSLPEQAEVNDKFRMSITPYFLAKCYENGASTPSMPLLMQVLPVRSEKFSLYKGLRDPLGENVHGASKGLVHRYGDRALWLITTPSCPIYCRYCTRKRITSLDEYIPSKKDDKEACEYLEIHKEIKTVIISGGDPLLLSDARLIEITKKIREIKHIDHIRIGTRFLSANPFRFTQNLLRKLADFLPVTFMVHINHTEEIDENLKEAVKLIRREGFAIKNQTVLLKGINDDLNQQVLLARELSKIGIDPHYVFLCDPVVGSDHFWVDPQKAASIYKYFLNEVDSLSRPRFVLDLPGGKGKVELTSENIISKGPNYFFKSKTGELVAYPFVKDSNDLEIGLQ